MPHNSSPSLPSRCSERLLSAFDFVARFAVRCLLVSVPGANRHHHHQLEILARRSHSSSAQQQRDDADSPHVV